MNLYCAYCLNQKTTNTIRLNKIDSRFFKQNFITWEINRKILQLKPGITGPASMKYTSEEEILAQQEDPVKYNNEVIYPDKVRINLEYMKHRTFWLDIKMIVYTVFGRKVKNA